MGTDSKIEWCHHTQNFWIGCTKVSAGCKFCYAENMMDKRYGRVNWGKGNPRSLTSEVNWLKPLAWDAAARKAGERHRVFAQSLSDTFDEEVPDEWRDLLFAVIHATPNLDWMLLTKRPRKALSYMTKEREQHIIAARDGMANGPLHRIYEASSNLGISHFPHWENVWPGTSVENQDAADERVPIIVQVPGVVHFLSCEPLLGPVDLRYMHYDGLVEIDALTGDHGVHRPLAGRSDKRIDLVIVGGESGTTPRPMHPDWARLLRDQCAETGTAFHFKQRGEWSWSLGDNLREPDLWVEMDGRVTTERDVALASGKWQGVWKVGKAKAGRLLDGREHNGMPEVVR